MFFEMGERLCEFVRRERGRKKEEERERNKARTEKMKAEEGIQIKLNYFYAPLVTFRFFRSNSLIPI